MITTTVTRARAGCLSTDDGDDLRLAGRVAESRRAAARPAVFSFAVRSNFGVQLPELAGCPWPTAGSPARRWAASVPACSTSVIIGGTTCRIRNADATTKTTYDDTGSPASGEAPARGPRIRCTSPTAGARASARNIACEPPDCRGPDLEDDERQQERRGEVTSRLQRHLDDGPSLNLVGFHVRWSSRAGSPPPTRSLPPR